MSERIFWSIVFCSALITAACSTSAQHTTSSQTPNPNGHNPSSDTSDNDRPASDEEKRAAYQTSCDANDALACSLLALHIADKDPKAADAFQQKACRLGDIEACVWIAQDLPEAKKCAEPNVDQPLCLAILGMQHTSPDQKNIMGALKTACDNDYPDGCFFLARMLELNPNQATPQQNTSSAAVEDVCKDQGAACYFSVEDPGQTISAQQSAEIVSLYKKACELGTAEGCFAAGLMYANGQGLPRDTAQAAALLSQACDAHFPAACTHLGIQSLSPANTSDANNAQALAWFTKACPADANAAFDAMGCLYASRMHALGVATPKDQNLSQFAAERICAPTYEDHEPPHVAAACFRDAALAYEGGLVGGPDVATAATFHEKACELGHTTSCYELGALYKKGYAHLPKNVAFAQAFLTIACDGAEPLGCRDMSALHLEGVSGQPDFVQAAQLLTKACTLGLIDDRCASPITPATLASQ